MFALTTRQAARYVSIVVMIALMFVFASSMARSYYESLRCITDMSTMCDSHTPDANIQMANNTGASDEWLCSTGETAYCQAPQPQGMEVVQLRN
jgi:hypothetical protein